MKTGTQVKKQNNKDSQGKQQQQKKDFTEDGLLQTIFQLRNIYICTVFITGKSRKASSVVQNLCLLQHREGLLQSIIRPCRCSVFYPAKSRKASLTVQHLCLFQHREGSGINKFYFGWTGQWI